MSMSLKINGVPIETVAISMERPVFDPTPLSQELEPHFPAMELKGQVRLTRAGKKYLYSTFASSRRAITLTLGPERMKIFRGIKPGTPITFAINGEKREFVIARRAFKWGWLRLVEQVS